MDTPKKSGQCSREIALTLKGKALAIALRTGLVPRLDGGFYNAEPFFRFWDELEPLLRREYGEAGRQPVKQIKH